MKYGLKAVVALILLSAAVISSSCKNKDNDAANDASGSFNENHSTAVDTSATEHDSITSNSTQTDPTANGQ